MSAPRRPLPGQGGHNGKSDADKEAEMKAQAAMQAMLDDLGNTRQDNLPLDDRPKHHNHGHNFQHGRRAYSHGFPAPPPARRTQPQGKPGGMGMGWSLDDVWKDAMNAGAFDDEDAHGVKGLDDLGGGRLYDNTGGGLSQRDRVTGKTMKILEQRDKRSAFEFSQQPIANKKIRGNEPNGGHRSATTSISKWKHHRVASVRSASRDTSMSGGSQRNQTSVNPMARPTRPPPPQPVRPLDLPMPITDIDPNTPLPFEIPNVLFKITVRFLSRDINPALPALVVLSAAKAPQLGFFTTVLFSRKFCEWPISAWYDYSTGADNQLGMSFQDGHSSFQGYQLYFNKEKELVQFMDIMRALKEGKHADEVGSTLGPASGVALPVKPTPAPGPRAPVMVSENPALASKTPTQASKTPTPASKTPKPAPKTPAPVSKTPAPVPRAPEPPSKVPTPAPRAPALDSKPPTPARTTTVGVSAAPTPVATKTSAHVPAPTKGKLVGPAIPQPMAVDVHKPQSVRQATQTTAGFKANTTPAGGQALAPITNGVAPPARTGSGAYPTTKVVNSPVQTDSQNEKSANPAHGTLIDLENDAESVADSQAPSEATELLSTLDPHDFSEGAHTHSFPADHVSRTEIVDTARNLFNFFLLTGTGGKAETLAQLNEMAEGVRSGVLEHMIQDARARGFSTEHLEEIRNMVNGVFAALIAAKKKTLPGHANSRVSRIQYTPFELLSMRHVAVQPPSFFFEVPYLPKPGDCPRKVSSSSRDRSFSQSSPKPRTTFDESQAAKSANAMQWALGAVESKPVPEAPKQESKKVEPDPVAAARPGDSGLQSSRWASDGAEIKHANYFTGPAYERTWSKRSYLEDLVQLNPHAKINAGTEDLMDLYFPVPVDEETEPGPTTARTSDLDGQVPPPTPSRPGPSTPATEMEKLRVRMARLSLLSPTGPRFVLASGEDQPSTSADVKDSDHPSTTAVDSGRSSGSAGMLASDQSSGSARVIDPDRPTSEVLMPSRARQSQPNPSIVPPPRVASRPAASPAAAQITKALRAMNATPSPIPARTSSLPAARAAPVPQTQANGAGPEQPAIPPPAQPTMRGLGASRHSSGTVLTSAGKFGHHVAGSGRK